MNRTAVRISAAAFGALMLAGLASTASVAAAETEKDSGEVNVTVQIPQINTPGVLAMSVAGTSTILTEGGSNNNARVFTGELPTVTVTDTRKAAEIPTGAYWYVMGSVSDFKSGTDTITADNLGWKPKLISGGASGLVAEGDPSAPKLDGGTGLRDKELLAMADDSGTVAPEGSWTANAALTLKTGTDAKAGNYSATLTLSLFE